MQDKPLDMPLMNYGYTIDVETRFKQHLAHRSSNFLMNLVETICHCNLNGKFHVEQNVIYLVWSRG